MSHGETTPCGGICWQPPYPAEITSFRMRSPCKIRPRTAYTQREDRGEAQKSIVLLKQECVRLRRETSRSLFLHFSTSLSSSSLPSPAYYSADCCCPRLKVNFPYRRRRRGRDPLWTFRPGPFFASPKIPRPSSASQPVSPLP